jgi:hypothetical protein
LLELNALDPAKDRSGAFFVPQDEGLVVVEDPVWAGDDPFREQQLSQAWRVEDQGGDAR